MIAPLERHTWYWIGLGDERRKLLYLGREFPDDHPPVYNFIDLDSDTGDIIHFLLPQLTRLEKQGALRYGDKHLG